MAQDESLGTIIISDSDDEARPTASPAAPLTGTKQPKLQLSVSASGDNDVRAWDSDVLVIDSTDSDEFDELEKRLKHVGFGIKAVGPAAPVVNSTTRPVSDVATSALESTRRVDRTQSPPRANTRLALSSSEGEYEKGAPSVFRAGNATAKLKLGEQAEQMIPKASIQKQQQKRSTLLERSKLSKGDLTRSKEIPKVQAKLQRDINKLVTDKKDTLKDFTVEISHTLHGHPFVQSLNSKLVAHDGSVDFFEPPSGVEHLVRFRRRHVARYDSALKEWVHIEPHTKLEDLYILFLSADLLSLAISENSLVGVLSALRISYNLTSRSQIFLMIDGMNNYYKRRSTHKLKRDVTESTMVSLQATERCFIINVDGPEDTAQWVFNITGDLGIKPHKRIRESFLPFCTDTKVKCGTSKDDTYKKMLQQIHGITESAADGIVDKVPTLRELFEGYAQEHNAGLRHNRLVEVTISNRKDGVAKSRIMNQALSKKVHDVIWGEDPLTLVD